MFDAALLGDLLMLAIVVGMWAVAILIIALAFDAVRKVVRGF